MGSNREGAAGVRDVDHSQEPGVRPASELLASGNGGGVDGNDSLCTCECGGGRGWASSSPYSGGCFVSGAAAGVLLYLLLTWLVVTRGCGKISWERWWNWLKVEKGWREAAPGEERAEKVGAGRIMRTVVNTNLFLRLFPFRRPPLMIYRMMIMCVHASQDHKRVFFHAMHLMKTDNNVVEDPCPSNQIVFQ